MLLALPPHVLRISTSFNESPSQHIRIVNATRIQAHFLTSSVCEQRFKLIKKIYEKISYPYYLPVSTRFLSNEFSNLHFVLPSVRSTSPAHPISNLIISDEDPDSVILGSKLIAQLSLATKIYRFF